jgi:hypothetical protein
VVVVVVALVLRHIPSRSRVGGCLLGVHLRRLGGRTHWVLIGLLLVVRVVRRRPARRHGMGVSSGIGVLHRRGSDSDLGRRRLRRRGKRCGRELDLICGEGRQDGQVRVEAFVEARERSRCLLVLVWLTSSSSPLKGLGVGRVHVVATIGVCLWIGSSSCSHRG